MSGKSISSDDKKNHQKQFYKNQKIFNIYVLDVDKILFSQNESYRTKNSLKYFIGYNDDDDIIRPICIKPPQMTGYAKYFDSNKTMSFYVF